MSPPGATDARPAAARTDAEAVVMAEVAVDDPAWRTHLSDAETTVQHALAAAHRRLAGGDTALVSVLLTSDARQATLNQRFRDREGATNVLAFPHTPLPDAPGEAAGFLGDISIAAGVTIAEAAAEGKSVADHVSHLVVHGYLHLVGHDHESDAQAAAMAALEVAALADLGIADPYRVPQYPVDGAPCAAREP